MFCAPESHCQMPECNLIEVFKMRGRKSAMKSRLNFVIDFMRSPWSAFGNSSTSHLAVSLDAC